MSAREGEITQIYKDRNEAAKAEICNQITQRINPLNKGISHGMDLQYWEGFDAKEFALLKKKTSNGGGGNEKNNSLEEDTASVDGGLEKNFNPEETLLKIT